MHFIYNGLFLIAGIIWGDWKRMFELPINIPYACKIIAKLDKYE